MQLLADLEKNKKLVTCKHSGKYRTLTRQIKQLLRPSADAVDDTLVKDKRRRPRYNNNTKCHTQENYKKSKKEWKKTSDFSG